MNHGIPNNIKNLLEGYTIENGPSGLSGASIKRFRKLDKICFLKEVDVKNKFAHELETELKLLKWLEGRFLAPKAITFEKTSNKHFLLMTAVEGITLEEVFNQGAAVEDVVRIYGESLKLIHSIDVKECPINADDETMLKRAKTNLELGMNTENMEDEYKDLSPYDLYNKLLSLKPEINENVFVHGDYCFDNIIINNNKLNGIIDVGRGGIGDKYKDIALAVRNIRGDFGEKWLNLFFDTYGLKNPNWDKIEFYIIMDEFF